MKILVTGGNGQLGNEIRELVSGYPAYEFIFTDLPELDLTDDRALDDFIDMEKPGVIINCAAYTAVDKAEMEVNAAKLINRDAVQYLALAAARMDAFLVHISTDYVFNSTANKPFEEEDPAHPLSVYGSTKLAGEQEVLFNAKRAVIIRTSWLYSAFGINFVRTMLRLGKENKTVNVVSDQLGSPTYAHDLAKAILDILPKCLEFNDIKVFHYSNLGVTSWYYFAQAIFEIAGIDCHVNPIRTKDYPTLAQRPLYSVLNTSRIRAQFNIELPEWRDSLRLCLTRLGETIKR